MELKKQFQTTLNRIGNYFGIKISSDIIREYYNQLYYIEQDIFQEICTKIINDRKPFKSNFPTITQFGPLYEAHNPQSAPSEFEPEECEECNGEGLIYFKFWHFKHGIIYSSHVACSKCNNWKKRYSTLEPYPVYSGDGKFLYRHPGIEKNTKEQLSLKDGVIEISENGVFKMTAKQLSDRVLEIYGNRL